VIKKKSKQQKRKEKGNRGKRGREKRGEESWFGWSCAVVCCVWDGREVELIAWDGVMAWGGIGRVPLYSPPLQDCYISKQLSWA